MVKAAETQVKLTKMTKVNKHIQRKQFVRSGVEVMEAEQRASVIRRCSGYSLVEGVPANRVLGRHGQSTVLIFVQIC